MLRAFARTQVLRGPGRADVDLAMSKWWTKKRPTEGQVRHGRFADGIIAGNHICAYISTLNGFSSNSFVPSCMLDYSNYFGTRTAPSRTMASNFSQEGK